MATTYTLGQVAIISKGEYSPTATYSPLNTVKHRAGSFMCISECSGVEPGVSQGWSTYWVPTAVGIYATNVSAQGDLITVTFTFSDGSTASHQYTSSTPPSVEYQCSIAGDGSATSWAKSQDKDGNPLSEVTSSSILVVTVDPVSFTPGRNYGVRMSTYGNGSVTFVSDTAIPNGTTVYMNVLVVR